ncbi:nucleotidyltransferase family protein [Paenibacillus sp. FSL R7-0345]|uniref:nucleotidyltransferase family protein n=1 Tax=Paenibacillus sp. FSL R7-0345 TaxID=2954535 RepID=UPI003159C6FD
MRINNEQDLLQAVKEDPWMMDILAAVSTLGLPDCWVCAGFVRSKVWDLQHGFSSKTPLADVDVIYFDPDDLREETEKIREARLREIDSSVPWSVKNQARMHVINGLAPYTSSTDGMAHFPETATALGLALTPQDGLRLSAPHGIRDAIGLVVRPSPFFTATPQLQSVYEQRVAKKNWRAVWPLLQVVKAAGS